MKKETVPISVLMSVYNGEDYLSESIESILNQTFSNFEFIIINDGSTDGSCEIIEEYAKQDNRIKTIHQRNMGLTKSLNKGMRMALGKYIARQDVGDISLPDRLLIQKEYLDNHPNIVLLGTSLDLIDEGDQIINTKIQPSDVESVKKILVRQNCFSHGSMMYRKSEILKLGGYRENLTFAQDYDLALRVSEKYDLSNLKKVLYQYRLDEKAISVEKIFAQRLLAEYIKKLAKQRRKYGKDDLQARNIKYIDSIIKKTSKQKKRHSNAEYHARIAHEYSAGGKQRKAIKYYFHSMKSYPFHIKNVLLLLRAYIRLLFKG